MDSTSTLIKQNNKRIINYDFLRIFATVAVVLIHCSASELKNWSPFELRWQICSLLDSISRWCVPVFVMISGALFLRGEHTIEKLLKKNVLRIVTAFAFWSTVFALYRFLLKKISLKQTVGEIIVGHYHLWFLFMIAGLYLAVPLLKKITESEKLTKYFLVLSLIFAFIIPMGTNFLSLFSESLAGTVTKITDNINLRIACGYTGYFVLGYFLSKAELSLRQRKLIYTASALGFAATVILASAFSCLKNTTVNVFYDYFSISVLLEAIGVFTFFRYKKFSPNKKREKTVLALSKYSFGVYLVHPLILETYERIITQKIPSLNSLVFILLMFVITLTVSFVISAVINRIPVLKKYIV